MRKMLSLLAGAAISIAVVPPAAAGVEFGAPNFSNYLTPPGPVSCDWPNEAYFRACPRPDKPPKAAETSKPKARKP